MIPEITASNGGGKIDNDELSQAIGAYWLTINGYPIYPPKVAQISTARIDGVEDLFTWKFKGRIYRVTHKHIKNLPFPAMRISFDYYCDAIDTIV